MKRYDIKTSDEIHNLNIFPNRSKNEFKIFTEKRKKRQKQSLKIKTIPP